MAKGIERPRRVPRAQAAGIAQEMATHKGKDRAPGWQEQADPHDQPTARKPVTIAQEMAEIVYASFYEYCKQHGNGKKPLRRWNELAVVERNGWRSAIGVLRVLVLGGKMIPVERPGEDQVTIAISDGNAYVSGYSDKSDMPEQFSAAMAMLVAKMGKLYEENPEQIRPGEDQNSNAAQEDAASQE